MDRKLLITDLDNTLYDWVTFFTASFRAMVVELARLLDTKEELLLSEFREVHRKYGNSEQPYALLEIPSVQLKFSELNRTEIIKELDSALHLFNRTRKQTLTLYPGVEEVLRELTAQGVMIVGHTEAILANSYWRLRSLKIDKYFSRLYTLEGKQAIHIGENARLLDPPPGFVTVVPLEERKPNPRLLADICKHEGVDLEAAYYIGDSIVRDISMANTAGVKSIWARYGTQYDPSCWTYLVKVTHWTDEDVEREKSLKVKFANVIPDFTIDSFEEVPKILGIERSTNTSTLRA
jgi:phosphoglycolate phosphatase